MAGTTGAVSRGLPAPRYRRNEWRDSHLKALLVHHEVIVPITAGRLDFGPWQQIFYAEFDGQRDKRMIVKVMGE